MFNSHHIRQFNQRCRHLVGEGKVVFTHKECRDLQSELVDVLLHIAQLEQQVADLKEAVAKSNQITIELDGKGF